MSKEDRALLTEDTHVIINSAASVSFDDPIRDALDVNFFGPQRILELAKECKQLEVMTHISTAYVNSNISPSKGPIDEKIYWADRKIFEHVKQLCSETDEYLATNLKSILGDFPNTYTYTKNLSEKALTINQGNVKICILRPSIIGASHVEPFPGWTDTLSAAGGLIFLNGTGLKHAFPM